MTIIIKVPILSTTHPIKVNQWHKKLGDWVARGETLVDLKVDNELLPIIASQAGIVEKIFFQTDEEVKIQATLAILKESLPNIAWDEEQQTLILQTYYCDSKPGMEYELRQLLRTGEGQYGGYGSALALPQNREQANPGMGEDAQMTTQKYLKSNPLLAQSSQFSGDFKDPRVTSVPSEIGAQVSPQNAPSFQHQPGSAPSPAPKPR